MRTGVKQAGDTIVEVLIAMLIVSMILGGAFAASNRSQKSVQQAQEHTTALKIAEGQLEQLNAAAPSSSIFAAGLTTFYMNGTTPTNGTLTTTNGVSYLSSITRAAIPAGDTDHFLFTITVSWNNINGNSQDSVILNYKVDTP